MGEEKKQKSNKDVDIYRDTPVRYLGYSNEVGESFRALVPVNVVRFSYVLASGYVCADAISKGRSVYKTFSEDGNISSRKRSDDFSQFNMNTGMTREVGSTVVDTLIWQALASVIIPGFTINRLCFVNHKILERLTRLPLGARKLFVTAIGLASIPLIIQPIDRFVDWVMNRTMRKGN